MSRKTSIAMRPEKFFGAKDIVRAICLVVSEPTADNACVDRLNMIYGRCDPTLLGFAQTHRGPIRTGRSDVHPSGGTLRRGRSLGVEVIAS